jgi:CHASE2 domain-containing sensor protein
MNDDPSIELMNHAQANVVTTAGAHVQPWTADLVIYLATSILLVTALALVLGSILMWKRANSSQDILRLYGVVIIVGLSALLLVTGFSNEQLTPIVGLFGAIAGYLLGKESKPAKDE